MERYLKIGFFFLFLLPLSLFASTFHFGIEERMDWLPPKEGEGATGCFSELGFRKSPCFISLGLSFRHFDYISESQHPHQQRSLKFHEWIPHLSFDIFRKRLVPFLGLETGILFQKGFIDPLLSFNGGIPEWVREITRPKFYFWFSPHIGFSLPVFGRSSVELLLKKNFIWDVLERELGLGSRSNCSIVGVLSFEL
jgi:hypothetical protein